MRVAVVHDWLTGMRGGERVLEAILAEHPGADIFTLVHGRGSVSAAIEAHRIHPSPLQRAFDAGLPWRRLLPLFPAALARFDLSAYDLVLSTSHCVAKAASGRRDVPHVSYIHSPMRYLWDQFEAYFGRGRASALDRTAMRLVAPALRRWDVRTAARPDVLVANSAFIADRIHRVWNRRAGVLHPPVDVARFRPAAQREDFHLFVGALVPYKRVDLAVEAFRRNGRRLIVVGEGPELDRLRAIAPGNVTFTGRLSDTEVEDLMGRCRTFLQPGEEDFGIAVVEAMAAGAPIVALGRGGACETVVDATAGEDRATGVLYPASSPDALAAAVERACAFPFRPSALRRQALRFAPHRFRAGWSRLVGRVLRREAA